MIEIRKKLMISAIIPAYNEQDNIENVINNIKKTKEIDEIIVVDDGSTDGTHEVAKRCKVGIISLDKNKGKGHAMKVGSSHAKGDILLFLDADLKNITSDKIRVILEPFKDMYDFVKTKFDRNKGRVTQLTARPLLIHFFPEIVETFEQPLSGQIGIKKSLFEKLSLEDDYGVDIGILIDAIELGGKAKEVYFGYVEHNEKTLNELDAMAKQVSRTILNRASKYNRLEKGLEIIHSQYT